jgi:hypothetical protein
MPALMITTDDHSSEWLRRIPLAPTKGQVGVLVARTVLQVQHPFQDREVAGIAYSPAAFLFIVAQFVLS